MAGVSSESLSAAVKELEPSLPHASLGLASELFSVLTTIDSSAGLRRSLSDVSRPAKDKTALVERLFGGKVSPQAVSIVSSLASSRWANNRDLGDALETLAATVAIAVAENRTASSDSQEHGTGITGLEQLENDLFSFNAVVESSHDVQRALTAPQATSDAKETLASRLVPGACDEAALLIRHAAGHPRGSAPTKLLASFAKLAASRQQRWIAVVTVSRALSDTQLVRLTAGLNSMYGRDLKVNVSVDPTLIGGVRVQVGDEVVDASTISRLNDLHRKLAS
ncbi:MAG: F0F1 ATP synthase subunit delta [Acidobacteria bacterium]|nr:F0F1 ATP synthase subunit delta [Acidobacteriota bacterium]